MVKTKFYFFLIWLTFNFLIYLLSSPQQERLIELTFLNVGQVFSLVGMLTTRGKVVNVILGGVFIICNHLIIKLLDPFPPGIGVFVSLASSLIAVIVLTNIKKEGKPNA